MSPIEAKRIAVVTSDDMDVVPAPVAGECVTALVTGDGCAGST